MRDASSLIRSVKSLITSTSLTTALVVPFPASATAELAR